MSYDLVFWKQAPGVGLDPRAVYRASVDGENVDGLLPFPIDDFVARVQAALPNATADRSGTNQIFWLDEQERLLCEMSWSRFHVVATMRPLNEAVANRLIDVAASLDAPLYDPQVNERFG